jgi:DNA-binding FrmR family transcriptional regulator
MSELVEVKTRTELLNRLKRAEGQLRGIQRMIEDGQSCMDIAVQMVAVRKALDSTYVRLTVCFMQQALNSKLATGGADPAPIDGVLRDVQALLGKLR